MTRYVSRDIRDVIVDLLNNGGTDGRGNTILSFNDYLATVDAKRGETTKQARKIDYTWNENQKPFILVDMQGSEIINDEELTSDYELTPEVFTCWVMFRIKATNEELQNYAENWIESIIGVLHGYCNERITWILATDTDIADLYQDKNQTEKAGRVSFEIRIN